MLNNLPLSMFLPLRLAAVRLRRGNPVRSLCVVILKRLARNRHVGRELGIFAPLDHPQLRFRGSDSPILDAIYWFGLQGYEGILIEVWRQICARCRTVVEIGANVGAYTISGAAAQHSGACYRSVEPLPEVAKLLRDNVELNGLDHVQVIQAAAVPATADGQVLLNIPIEAHDIPVGAHLVGATNGIKRSSARTVPVTPLPFAKLAADADAIKIDAEGIECQLLDSIRDVIVERRPLILVELLPTSGSLAALLAHLGETSAYRLYIVPEWRLETLIEVPPAMLNARLPGQFHSKDVIASPAPLMLSFPVRPLGDA